MKRVFSLLVLVLLLNGCDDGNLTLETIDFEDAQTQTCTNNDIIYKLKESEALLLEIPKTSFVNNPTIPGTPTVINIDNSTYRVVYRFYNGKVTTDNICNTIPPATPYVNDQWVATSGKIEITTTTITQAGSIAGSTVITGYNHHIVFKDITFDKGNGEQRYDTFDFGDYTTTSSTLPFGFDKNVEQCSSAPKDVYNYIGSEALTLENLDTDLIANVETPVNTPRTALIGAVKNKLTYRLYNGLLTPSYFCNLIPPATPTIDQEWNGQNGVANESGIIEVTTIKSGTTAFKHTIIIRNATLKYKNSTFKLGDVYTYGELITF
jgi:PBP1b-binding outer membrane lipoprotein LpoB